MEKLSKSWCDLRRYWIDPGDPHDPLGFGVTALRGLWYPFWLVGLPRELEFEAMPGTINIQIRRLAPGDEDLVELAHPLFDDPAHPDAVRAFLANPANYLLVAYVDGHPAGFITGHELQRLDSPRPMLFLYELGVAAAYRGHGIGTALLKELARLGQERGCREMFVLTNEANEPAMRTYAAAGGQQHEDRDIALFEWQWEPAIE